ncbi:MAG: DegT/DnrJ/EryC1/StrS family aminotransferase [Chloroflexota bacterium]
MAQLAINGGPKTITEHLGSPWPVWDDTERRLLMEVLESGKWWRGGYDDPTQSKVGQFETAFARFQDAKHGVAVANGTVAIECALKAVGVEAGDEVIVPAATFVASATAPIQVGAVPIFVDIDPRNYTIDPAAVEAAITPRTRAVVAVDYGGMPCDMDALLDIQQRTGIQIVSDCAHAHGSQWKGVGVGAIGPIGTFSFQAFKQLPTGEGGMVLTNDDAIAERAYSYHHIGRIRGRPFYEHHVPASNLRMTEWQGAIGLAQFSRLLDQTLIRERNAMYLAQGLEQIDGVSPLYRDPRVTRWGFYMWHFKFQLEGFGGISRDTFLRALGAEGVHAGTGHTEPLYHNPVFAHWQDNFGRTGFPIRNPYSGQGIDYTTVKCPQAERIYRDEAIVLSHRLFLGPQSAMDQILAAIRKIREHIDELPRSAATTGAARSR